MLLDLARAWLDESNEIDKIDERAAVPTFAHDATAVRPGESHGRH
jgi:hypothetical protein